MKVADSPTRLVAFSPTAGMGVFLSPQAAYRFDLIADTIDVLADQTATTSQRFIGAFGSDISFESEEQLLAYAKREHLRSKKAEYFTALFTRNLEPTLFDDLLSFLNDSEISGLRLPREFRRRLEDTADAPCVISVLERTKTRQLRDLRLTLETEFGELIHSERLQRLEKTPPRIGADRWRIPVTAYAELVWNSLGNLAASKREPVTPFWYHADQHESTVLQASLSKLIKTVAALVGRRFGMSTETEDLAQETAVRLLNATASGRFPFSDVPPSRDALTRYISVICRNTALDSFRKYRSQAHGSSREVAFELEKHDVIDPTTESQRGLAGSERNLLLREAIATLSAQDQRLVQLLFFDSYTPSDAAVSLQMSLDKVYNRRSAIVKKLQKLLLSEHELRTRRSRS